MAVFILKAKHGLCYTPPACTRHLRRRPLPLDLRQLDRGDGRRGHHRRLRRRQLLPPEPRPARPDGRLPAQGRARLGLRAADLHAGIFRDVPCPSTFADWIEQLATENITGGCGGGNYCPANANTRADGRLHRQDLHPHVATPRRRRQIPNGEPFGRRPHPCGFLRKRAGSPGSNLGIPTKSKPARPNPPGLISRDFSRVEKATRECFRVRSRTRVLTRDRPGPLADGFYSALRRTSGSPAARTRSPAPSRPCWQAAENLSSSRPRSRGSCEAGRT